MTPDCNNSRRELIHRVVKETVHVGLESQLRKPILEAVEEADGEPVYQSNNGRIQDGTADPKEKSWITMAIQGLIVFLVMFVTLYVILRKLTDGENQ